jgi:hypothetical protein
VLLKVTVVAITLYCLLEWLTHSVTTVALVMVFCVLVPLVQQGKQVASPDHHMQQLKHAGRNTEPFRFMGSPPIQPHSPRPSTPARAFYPPCHLCPLALVLHPCYRP